MTDQKIILTRGLQASGKTTWAKDIVRFDPSYARVNRDEIRLMLNATTFGGTIDEDLVTRVETQAVLGILKSGRTPIVDATHLYQRHINRWQRLGYPIEIVEFGAPLEVLLKRNEERGTTVPPEVIAANALKFARADTGDLSPVKLTPEHFVTSRFEKYVPNKLLAAAYICDIDGTLAHMTGRSPYDYSQVGTDKVDESVREVLIALAANHHIIIVSGRKAECREETLDWLNANFIPFDKLYMRADGDDRPDSIVKYEILRDKIAPKFEVRGVFDDRNPVVQMWRDAGLKCFHVQEGDF